MAQALDQLYKQAILEHNRNPRNRGRVTRATHQARGVDALCGDDLLLEIQVGEDGIIQAAGFDGEACAVTTASASMMTEWLAGREVTEALQAVDRFARLLDEDQARDDPELGELNQLRQVGQFPARKRNALLPWTTLRKALTREQGDQT